MIKVEKDHTDLNCQVCNARGDNVYNITLSNGRFGVELHLCRECCKELRSLLKFTQMNGVKLVSIDNIDK